MKHEQPGDQTDCKPTKGSCRLSKALYLVVHMKCLNKQEICGLMKQKVVCKLWWMLKAPNIPWLVILPHWQEQHKWKWMTLVWTSSRQRLVCTLIPNMLNATVQINLCRWNMSDPRVLFRNTETAGTDSVMDLQLQLLTSVTSHWSHRHSKPKKYIHGNIF